MSKIYDLITRIEEDGSYLAKSYSLEDAEPEWFEFVEDMLDRVKLYLKIITKNEELPQRYIYADEFNDFKKGFDKTKSLDKLLEYCVSCAVCMDWSAWLNKKSGVNKTVS